MDLLTNMHVSWIHTNNKAWIVVLESKKMNVSHHILEECRLEGLQV